MTQEQKQAAHKNGLLLIKEIKANKLRRDLKTNANYDLEYEKMHARHEDDRVMRKESLLGYTKNK